MRLRALVEQIDRNLAIYRFRRGVTLERLVTSMAMLIAIDHRVDELCGQRSRALSMAAHPSAGA